MTAPERSLEQIFEELRDAGVTSEQAFAFAGAVSAAELRRAEPEPPTPPFDLATAVAFDLDHAVNFLADRYLDAIGIDADLFGAWVLREAVRAGASEAAVREIVERRTGWRPRSAEAA